MSEWRIAENMREEGKEETYSCEGEGEGGTTQSPSGSSTTEEEKRRISRKREG